MTIFAILEFYFSVVAISAPVLGVAIGGRWSLAILLFAFPWVHPYLGGGVLFVHLLVLNMGRRRPSLYGDYGRYIILLWGLWLIFAVVSTMQNGINTRQVLAIFEHLFYGALCVLLLNLIANDNSYAKTCFKALFWSAITTCIVIVMFHYGVTEITSEHLSRNERAVFISLFGQVGAVWLLLQKGSHNRLLGLCASGLIVLSLVVLQSRSSMLATACVFSAVLLYNLAFRRLFVFVVVSALAAYIGYSVLEMAGGVEAFVRVDDGSTVSRKVMMQYSLSLFEQKYLFGWGVSSMEVLTPNFGETKYAYIHPHNTLARLAVETGLGGVAFFFGVLGLFAFSAVARYRERDHVGFTICLVWFLAFLCESMAGVLFYGASRAIIVVIALALALGNCRQLQFGMRSWASREAGTPAARKVGFT